MCDQLIFFFNLIVFQFDIRLVIYDIDTWVSNLKSIYMLRYNDTHLAMR